MMKMLDEIPKRNPFRVPGNYFEEINMKIISSTSEKAPVSRKPGIYSGFRPYLALAAAVAAFVLLGYAALKILGGDKERNITAESGIQEYSIPELNEIDIATLEEYAANSLTYDERPDVSNSTIIDYLILENIEINEIYELL